jgi:aminoglycoside phosphotransferase (APT) family kinase protein
MVMHARRYQTSSACDDPERVPATVQECIMPAPFSMSPTQEPRIILQSLGLDVNATIVPLGGGWSGSTIFRVSTAEPGHDLVLRILAGDAQGPQREAAIHQLVRRYGLPAPEIVAIGPISGGTAMLMPLMPGIPLVDILPQTSPTTATAWGLACGTMLAQIHAIPPNALANLALPSWLQWVPPSPAVVRVLEPWLADPACALPTDRLLHLDYHPANLLGTADTIEISAVLDWTNARLGPPIADLARTRVILRLFAASGIPSAVQAAIVAFESGLQTGWERHFGPIKPAMMRAFDAWALDVQIADLAPKLAMPGSWVSIALLDALRINRDAAIATCLAELKP